MLEPREEIRYVFLQYLHQISHQQSLKNIPAPNGCYIEDRQCIRTQEEEVQLISEPRRIYGKQVRELLPLVQADTRHGETDLKKDERSHA